MSGLNNKHAFLTVPGVAKSKIKAPAGSVGMEEPLLGTWRAVFSLCPDKGQGASGSSVC